MCKNLKNYLKVLAKTYPIKKDRDAVYHDGELLLECSFVMLKAIRAQCADIFQPSLLFRYFSRFPRLIYLSVPVDSNKGTK